MGLTFDGQGALMRNALIAVVLVALLPVGTLAHATPEARPQASPVAGDVGTTVRVGTWSVTLVGAEFSPDIAAGSWLAEEAFGTFLIVRLNVVNEGIAPVAFPYDDAYVADDQHRLFTPNHSAMLSLLLDEFGLTPGEELQPGVTYPYALVFDVAPDATGFRLSLTGKDGHILDLGV
jgi:hypothetical protein